VTEKEPLLAGVVSGRRFAVAEVDDLDRNRWTIWIGISGRVQPEWVDDLGRNGWTISPGIGTGIADALSKAVAYLADGVSGWLDNNIDVARDMVDEYSDEY